MRERDAVLADGTAIHLRPVRPSDGRALLALHSRFSDRTRYLRFFSPYPRIPARDLYRFVNVDHHDREAIVALVGADIVAICRYERLGGTDDAEIAFVVEDAYQGRGIAPVLLAALAEAARENGVERFVAEVLPDNRPMMHVFQHSGYQVSTEFVDGVTHITFPITPGPRPESPSGGRARAGPTTEPGG
jgi:RimJ/RimL family protein N-acetyltransferase